MKNYKHIICAIDLSKHSEKVVNQAVEFRDAAHARLSVVHFVEPLPITAYNIGTIDIQESIVENAKKEINKLAEQFQLREDELHIIADHPKRSISALTKQFDGDLIIIGHSEHGLLGSLLGSTAAAVVNHTPCDVFIIKNN
ncbi:MAG: universal stress protein [Endozoicomonadaceae bacterium]|nr:universal stress protein [Endozoicomonadaceae bacterium]MCY4328671.1 universal stress protein [Endozoicomonadaceae bacterium]